MQTHHAVDRRSTSWAQTHGWLGLRVAIGAAWLALALAFASFGPGEHDRIAMQAHARAHH